VRPVGVVLDSPGFDNDPGLEQRGELLGVEQLVITRLMKDSTKGFSQGEPGSMTAVRVPAVRQ